MDDGALQRKGGLKGLLWRLESKHYVVPVVVVPIFNYYSISIGKPIYWSWRDSLDS